MVEYCEKQFKSILNKHKFINPWGWNRYSISPYQGCQFNCIYCYARSQRYNRNLPGNTVFVKKNAAHMLDLRISRARTLLPDVVGMSGICDPYQVCEDVFKTTRQCLEVLARHGWPVHIWTKSPLVLRDLDILSEIAETSWAAVSFTITTTDNEIARFLEPNAVLPEERFEAISEIKKTNIQTGVTAIPIVPFLEDSKKDIESLVKRAKKAGADYVLFSSGMTMENDQALRFLKTLARVYPELVEKFEDVYRFKYSSKEYNGLYSPEKSYTVKTFQKAFEIFERFEMPYRVKRFIPSDFRKIAYIVAENLLNEACRLQDLGKAWSNTYWAGQNIQNLKEPIEDVAERGELQQIRNVNSEIESFIKDVLENLN